MRARIRFPALLYARSARHRFAACAQSTKFTEPQDCCDIVVMQTSIRLRFRRSGQRSGIDPPASAPAIAARPAVGARIRSNDPSRNAFRGAFLANAASPGREDAVANTSARKALRTLLCRRSVSLLSSDRVPREFELRARILPMLTETRVAPIAEARHRCP